MRPAGRMAAAAENSPPRRARRGAWGRPRRRLGAVENSYGQREKSRQRGRKRRKKKGGVKTKKRRARDSWPETWERCWQSAPEMIGRGVGGDRGPPQKSLCLPHREGAQVVC